MIRLYILGLLERYGPQHGYHIKKLIAEQLADFTQIKLPTIYYHLDKMAAEGLLSASSKKDGARPEKTVYTITERGVAACREYLDEMLRFEYRPVFSSDGVFFFSEYVDEKQLVSHLESYITELEKALDLITTHKTETLKFIPEQMQTMAKIIFSHHECHYRTERDWAIETHDNLKGWQKI